MFLDNEQWFTRINEYKYLLQICKEFSNTYAITIRIFIMLGT